MQDSKIKNSEKKQMMYRLYAINDFETYINKDTSYYYGYSYLGWIYFYDYYDMEKSFIMFKKAIKLVFLSFSSLLVSQAAKYKIKVNFKNSDG